MRPSHRPAFCRRLPLALLPFVAGATSVGETGGFSQAFSPVTQLSQKGLPRKSGVAHGSETARRGKARPV